MKVLKVLLIVLLVIVLLIGGCAYYLFKNMNGYIATAIENIGSDALQTQVTVEAVDISIREGRAALNGFDIANLAGYQQPGLFELNQVAIDIDTNSLQSDVLIFDEILVDGARLTLEQRANGKANLQELYERLAPKGEREQPEPSSESGPEVKMIVRKLTFTDISMDVHSPYAEQKTLVMEDIERRNLGEAEGGLTPKQLGQAIIQPFVDRVNRQIKSRVGEEVNKLMEENLSEEEREKIKGLQNLIKEQ